MKLSELFVKYGGEVAYRPSKDDACVLEYRGYVATLRGDTIEYDPPLPTIDMAKTFKAGRPYDFKEIARKAIDLAHGYELKATGQAAQSGEIGNPPTSGPLRRANG